MNNKNTPPQQPSDEAFDNYPLFDSLDTEILMHRDAHFGGKFDIMLAYYEKGGRGARDELSIERILYLHEWEQKTAQNLAGILLSGTEAEKVARAKDSYKKLRDLFDLPKQKGTLPLLIANLILAEEEEIENALTEIIAQKAAIVPSLIQVLRSEDLSDPLFPGYGQAPALAVECLAKIGDRRALIILFEALGKNDFFTDDRILEAIHAIGEPAKEFLLKVAQGLPLNEDNEKAAMALISFKDEPLVAETCFDLLKRIAVKTHLPLATYLILVCAGLKTDERRSAFAAMAQDPSFPKIFITDIKTIVKSWSEINPQRDS